MHTVTLNIQDSVFEKVIYFLQNLPSDEVEIIEDNIVDDLSYLERAIDRGLSSGISGKSHKEVVSDIKRK